MQISTISLQFETKLTKSIYIIYSQFKFGYICFLFGNIQQIGHARNSFESKNKTIKFISARNCESKIKARVKVWKICSQVDAVRILSQHKNVDDDMRYSQYEGAIRFAYISFSRW